MTDHEKLQELEKKTRGHLPAGFHYLRGGYSKPKSNSSRRCMIEVKEVMDNCSTWKLYLAVR